MCNRFSKSAMLIVALTLVVLASFAWPQSAAAGFIGSAVVSKSLVQPATHVYVDGGLITGVTVDGGDYVLDNVPALKEDWFIHTPDSIWDPGG